MSVLARLKRIEDVMPPEPPAPDPDLIEEIQLLESSYYDFIKSGWHVYQPHVPFRDGKHIEAICKHIEALYDDRIEELVVNIPPGFGKSSTMGAFLTPWVWTRFPGHKFLYASASENVAIRDSQASRDIIKSDWYQKRWGGRFQIRRDTDGKEKYANNQGGVRSVTTIGTRVTGERTNSQIIDDPNNALDMDSEAETEKVITWNDTGMSTRMDFTSVSPKKVLIQQRLGLKDLTEHWLKKKNPSLVHFYLPMEFIPHDRCVTVPLKGTDGKPWQDWRTQPNELLWPDVFTSKHLEKGKRNLGSPSAIAGQYQQRPIIEGGSIIPIDKFRIWKGGFPKINHIVASWDCAMSDDKENQKSTASYSAVTVWGVFLDEEIGKNAVILLHMWKGRVEYPELQIIVRNVAEHYADTYIDSPNPVGSAPHINIIENKASGISLVQQLKRTMEGRIFPFDPRGYGNKIQRARFITPLIYQGSVWLPSNPKNHDMPSEMAKHFMQECEKFPEKGADDIVDSASQALIYLSTLKKLLKDVNELRVFTMPDFSKYPRA